MGLILLMSLPIVYMSIEFLSGFVTMVFFGILYFISYTNFQNHKDDADYIAGISYFKFLLYLQASSWIAQFIGHGVFERRAPALMNNILTTLVAPNFVIIEVLYFFGYNKKQIEECQKIIDEDIKEYWEGGKDKTG